MDKLQKLQPYTKFIVAIVGAVLTVVAQYYGNNSVVQTVLPILTALGVYQLPNKG